MKNKEALTIIHSLANGIDPFNGELITHHLYNNPQVIRAMFRAATVLEEAKEKPEKKGNSGKLWTDEEDDSVISMWQSGKPLSKIAEIHGRTPGSIAARLVKHGLIENPYAI